ncbi:MAG: 50S ribosomal protein L1 [Phycisphaerae bacterium]|nr:50S ribosomal protein L1 [Phycisphaerae bacterium]
MAVHGKRYNKSLPKAPTTPVSLEDAIKALRSFDQPKFDQTVELCLWLGIDPKQADQAIRGAISLPKGIGKSYKVIAFVPADMADAAKAAGAIEAGEDDLVKKVNDGWMDFDVAVAHPRVMGKVGRLGRVLGPQGKMPSPKSGTVTDAIEGAIREYSAGKIEFRNDAGGNLHTVVGKLSFSDADLLANINAFVDHIKRMRPVSAKGVFIKKATLSGTMTPGVQVTV